MSPIANVMINSTQIVTASVSNIVVCDNFNERPKRLECQGKLNSSGCHCGSRMGRADVRFGSKADMCSAKRHVCFTPESGHVRRN
jgi:hypothetical protein